ncbi:hypothetical protein FM114_04350 [Luteococcus japonicus LSP_Lj1]|uniref:Uncharacterized protein n=1 Tax=Luteococcus japonicus LSP_Lj1 TaxID=1255658 RepID=A0A1R4IYW1_9ACTN|nr:hypothetical protein FM114_04350 [Luteococcus japonicus LSP_Lj1]
MVLFSLDGGRPGETGPRVVVLRGASKGLPSDIHPAPAGVC